MAGKRLTRKEIQEDQIQDALRGTYAWVAENRNLLIASIAGVLLIVAVVYGLRGYGSKQDDRLQIAFADAMKIFQAPTGPDPLEVEPGHEGHGHLPLSDLHFDTVEERDQKAYEAFREIAQNYSGPLADFSAYYAAVAQDQLGNASEAESSLRSLADRTRTFEVRSLAYNYLATIGERTGNWELAIDSLTKLNETAASGSSYPRETALYKLAQALDISGKKAEALEEYRKIIAEFPQHPNSREITNRIDILSAVLGDTTPPIENPDSQES